ncbi:MAG: type 1 glutamine amidotransferase domain-containing protein [Psychrobium sp.]
MKKVLIPLPKLGFDPSEAAIPWLLMTQAGFEVTFITPDGSVSAPDPRMLHGHNLGLLKPVLAARQEAAKACKQMLVSSDFTSPLSYDAINSSDYDALLLPGGHDKTVKDYLESTVLQQIVVDFFKDEKPVAGVCHGILVAARSIDPETGKSVLYDYQTTALLKSQELLGYNLTRLWLGDYYLTYPETTVEDEVKACLKDESQFHQGPFAVLRDTPEKLTRGFIVKDRHYISARWPGDIYNLSFEFIDMIRSA